MTLSIERCLIFANQCTDMSETSLKSMIPFLLNGRYILYFVKLQYIYLYRTCQEFVSQNYSKLRNAIKGATSRESIQNCSDKSIISFFT